MSAMSVTEPNGDRAKLERLTRQLADLHHDLQNPLSVLTGNVELLNEIAGEVEVDPSIMQSLNDIHAASGILVDMLARLKTMRDEIA